MSDEVTLHPIAAELAEAMERSPDGTAVSFPTAAVERAAQKVRATADDEALTHLIALAVKIKRIAGEGGTAAIMSIGLIVADKLGSTAAAADRLVAAGLEDDAKSFLGRKEEKRAPAQPQTAGPAPVKAKRGLS